MSFCAHVGVAFAAVSNVIFAEPTKVVVVVFLVTVSYLDKVDPAFNVTVSAVAVLLSSENHPAAPAFCPFGVVPSFAT